MDSRRTEWHRKTAETDITLRLHLDGSGVAQVNTGLPFFDHMLTLFARHGLFDLEIEAEGDLAVDAHHTVEDVGIVLGHCLKEALGKKTGIVRYGMAYLPMDESLARVVVDLSGRGHLEARLPRAEPVGAFSFQLVEEFLRAFAINAACTLHAEILYGRNSHHMAEALFKGLGRALDQATRIDARVRGIPSTKEVL
jgi:imidazoleglycerol-phosphate dehydratase